MNTDILSFLCKSQASIWNIPTKLYNAHILVQSFDPFASTLTVDITLPYIDQLFDTQETINYCVTTDLLIMGMVKDKSSSHSVIIGPICIGEVSENIARKLLTSNKYPLRLDQMKELTKYLFLLPHFHIDQFINILGMLYVSINHEMIPLENIMKPEAEYNIQKEVEYNMLEEEEKTSFHGIPRRNPHDFEAAMLFFIKHGMTKHLKELKSDQEISSTGILAFDTLRHYKNAIIILNSLSIRASIAGGLSPETSYQLGEIYIRKIEACINLKQLNNLSLTLRIDYCERVRALQSPNVEDPTINKAIHYIDENIHKKLLASEIANKLSISNEYFSTRFKHVTGSSYSNYVTRQKVLEAKRLLRLTDKPLSEISEYLSFSSQSYFQNIFKKIVGITPLEYRSSSDESIF